MGINPKGKMKKRGKYQSDTWRDVTLEIKGNFVEYNGVHKKEKKLRLNSLQVSTVDMKENEFKISAIDGLSRKKHVHFFMTENKKQRDYWVQQLKSRSTLGLVKKSEVPDFSKANLD